MGCPCTASRRRSWCALPSAVRHWVLNPVWGKTSRLECVGLPGGAACVNSLVGSACRMVGGGPVLPAGDCLTQQGSIHSPSAGALPAVHCVLGGGTRLCLVCEWLFLLSLVWWRSGGPCTLGVWCGDSCCGKVTLECPACVPAEQPCCSACWQMYWMCAEALTRICLRRCNRSQNKASEILVPQLRRWQHLKDWMLTDGPSLCAWAQTRASAGHGHEVRVKHVVRDLAFPSLCFHKHDKQRVDSFCSEVASRLPCFLPCVALAASRRRQDCRYCSS